MPECTSGRRIRGDGAGTENRSRRFPARSWGPSGPRRRPVRGPPAPCPSGAAAGGRGATQVGFGELGIASECKRPFPHGLFDLAERDQCGRFVQVDSVDCARIDCGVEEVESRFVVAGGGSQDSLELEQPRLIKLNGKATVDVVLGSAIIPAEKANPCTNQVSLRRVGRNLKSPRGSGDGRIFLV